LKISRIIYVISFMLAGLTTLLFISPLQAAGTAVSIDAPPGVISGENFSVSINIGEVSDLIAFQVDMTYDNSVIRVVGAEGGPGVTAGQIGPTVFPIDMWGFIPPGEDRKIRILGRIPGMHPVSGQGYLTRIDFQAVGSVGQSTNLIISNLMLIDPEMQIINPVTISNSSVAVFNLAISTAFLPEATQGSTYLTTLESSGGQSPYTWSASGLPSGLTMSESGQISGIPLVAGSFPLQLQVSDSFNPANTANRDLTMQVFPLLRINTASLPEAWTSYSYSTILSAGGGKNPYHWSADSLPSGLTISESGEISGVPSEFGSFNINVTVTDSYNPVNSISQNVFLKIHLLGDVDENGLVDIRDVIKVERIILLKDAVVPGADVDRDNRINMADVAWIEMIILKL
jgi:hypothetical protein